MKLIRFGEINKERTGVIIDNEYYDTSVFGEDYNEQFFGSNGLYRLEKFISANKTQLPKISETGPAGKSFCTAFKDHLYWD
jgi:hypothetical protein